MLLDPFEKQFDLPATFVKSADGFGRKSLLIGQKNQRLAGLGILETDSTQMIWVILLGVVAVQSNRLIADNASIPICCGRINPMEIHIGFGAGYKKGSCLMQKVQPPE